MSTTLTPATGQTIHRIKAWPRYFAALWDGTKTFEVRRDDRAYAEGDQLHIYEFNPALCHRAACKSYTCDKQSGRVLVKTVTYVLPGGQFGIEPGYVVLGLSDEEPRSREATREITNRERRRSRVV